MRKFSEEKRQQYLKNQRERRRKERIENPLKYKAKKLKERYKIKLEDYMNLLKQQNFMCANPGCIEALATTKSTHLDHCHATGAIRGILCRSCNISLGLLKENCSRIIGLSNYISKFNGNNRVGELNV